MLLIKKMMDKIKIGSNTIETLIAITASDHEHGLMDKVWPPPVMSFPYNTAAVRKFWMKKTISPLDLIFCCAGRVVAIEIGTPLSLEYIGPNEPTDLVVEMPRGMTKKLGIVVGQEISLHYSLRTMAARYSHTLGNIA